MQAKSVLLALLTQFSKSCPKIKNWVSAYTQVLISGRCRALSERAVPLEAKVGLDFMMSGLLTIGPVFVEKVLLLTSGGTALRPV